MKKIFIVLFTAVFAAVACSDWTKPEALDYIHKGVEETDPAGYEAYLKSIREYKATDHKVMILNVSGTDAYPVSQSQLLMAMPDSADYICVGNLENLHSEFVKQISLVKEKKATSVLSAVDFALAYADWLDHKIALSDNGSPAPTLDECKAYFKEHAARQFSYCGKYPFDGVIASFTGTLITDEEKASMSGFMEAVSEWRASNKDKLFMMRGNVNLLQDKSILAETKYIILVMGGDKGVASLRSKVRSVLSSIDQKDRIIFEAVTPSIDEPEPKGETIYEAAEDLVKLGDYTYGGKTYISLGLAVSNANDDYFNDSYFEAGDTKREHPVTYGNFVNIRRAINYLAANAN
ncbi:MAG: hypothetical protein K2O58_03550 [Bacteroidales bacterium]|nr:hypothetical protein [Bacteroidales bacterium]